jgi:hypothetical protein
VAIFGISPQTSNEQILKQGQSYSTSNPKALITYMNSLVIALKQKKSSLWAYGLDVE